MTPHWGLLVREIPFISPFRPGIGMKEGTAGEKGGGGDRDWKGEGGRRERKRPEITQKEQNREIGKQSKKASEPIFPFVASTRCFALLSSIVLCPK